MTFSNFDQFKQQFSGEVILPENSNYAQFKNSLFAEGSPAVILLPKNSNDIVAALEFVKTNKLTLSVRSGGHHGAGFSTNKDGAVIDMKNFNTVEIIDESKHIVKVGSGARWIDVAQKLHQHSLALSSGDTKTVGVGGLTLGGGIGWMVRKYGLTIDSLLAAEIVTADGKVVRASESENADLFWAIRGGGGNFGIVTYFEFQTYPIGKVYAGMITYPLDELKSVLTGWRDVMRAADENLTTIVNAFTSFGDAPAMIMINCCYAEDDEQKAMSAIEPLTKLGKMMSKDIKQKEYFEVLEDAHPPEGMKIITKNVFTKEFTDAMIQSIIEAKDKAKMFIMQIRSLGGAMKKVPVDKTAFTFRDNEVMVLSPVFLSPTATEAEISEALIPWGMIAKHGQGSYTNLLTELDEDLKAAYSDQTYQKLAEVKKKYDPTNLFSQSYSFA